MENKVGDTIPSDKKQAAIKQRFADLTEALQEFCITLDDRNATAKPPTGFEQWIPKLADLSKRYGVVTKSAPIAGMLADLELDQVLQQFESSAALVTQLIADTRLQAKSECWSAAMQNYGALGREADNDPALATELKPMQDFMRTRRKRKPGGGPGPAPGGGAPPAGGGTPPGTGG
jgi:hypothetical protein